MNVIVDKYKNRRKDILGFFIPKNKSEELNRIYSPSGKFFLTISIYKTGENTWKYSRGIIKETASEKIIADIKRNYSHFWHSWCQHNNGNEYLLCGEDYQGQTVVNLTKGTINNYFPEAGFAGSGFCWTDAFVSPDKKYLAVEGCYWACPYDIVFFDFSRPDHLPYKEIKRINDVEEIKGWDEEGNFILRRQIEIRKSDGIPFENLTQKEQQYLDNNQDLVSYKTIPFKFHYKELNINP